MVLARPHRRAAARLGDAPVRPLLAASGPGIATPRDALPRVSRRVRCAGRRCHHRAVPARAPRLPGRVHVLPEAGHSTRRRRVARAVGARRLSARDAGRHAGRVQRARRTHRPLPNGKPLALPARSLRRRHRDHQDLRRRYAAHALPGSRGSPAPGARIPGRRSGTHALSQPVPGSVRRGPAAFTAVQGREQRRDAGGNRVLPSAVLRHDGNLRRVSSAERRHRARRRRGEVCRAVLAGHRIALQAAARRPRTSVASAAGRVSAARRVQCLVEGIFAYRNSVAGK